MTVIPVFGTGVSHLKYVVLSEGVAAGELEIREQAVATVPGLPSCQPQQQHVRNAFVDASVSSDLLALWAKASKRAESQGSYHPLLCHMIDVAAVTRLLWREVLSAGARGRVAGSLGVSEADAEVWVSFVAGLHDVGKASPAFGFQEKAAGDRLLACGFNKPLTPFPRTDHGAITAKVLPDILRRLCPSDEVARRLAVVAGGHHGTFVSNTELNSVGDLAAGAGRWAEARGRLAELLAACLDLGSPPTRVDNSTAMFLAGLTAVADWIGSAEEYFPYVVQPDESTRELELRLYFPKAEGQAAAALKRLGWLGWNSSSKVLTFAELFPEFEPRPVQEEVVRLADQMAGPSVVVIEVPMGEGKTEAAMYLADRWSASEGLRGCYFALPTQATSNQMFGRVRDFLAARYPSDVVNVQLIHGHASLSAEFEELRRRADHLFQPTDVDQSSPSDHRGGVVAAEWFTYRKRGLLAPFGVGTIDQALLAALKTRHVFVRLFGLAHKTVIIDEVHAYDTYMTRLLERLLEWLASLDCSVVLLSATLPRSRRDALLSAFRRGLRVPFSDAPVPHAPYPRLSWATATALGSRSVAVSQQVSRKISVRLVDGRVPEDGSEPFALGEQLRDALGGGGCCAVICNTVSRAQKVYQALKPYFSGVADDGSPELDLLHARYLFEERDRREKRALTRFGKPGAVVHTADAEVHEVLRPSRAVLVTTQIVEQSLDLDFDLIVTDMAPLDLILQRAGRLHRHERDDDARPSKLRSPEIWACRPSVDDDGLPTFDQGTLAVYDHHVLLRSWLEMRTLRAVTVPDDVEALIEAVYDDRRCPEALGPGLANLWIKTRDDYLKQTTAEEREAQERWLKSPDYAGALWRLTDDPREEDAPDFHIAHQALTRLAEITVQVVLLYGTRERPSFDASGCDGVDIHATPSVALARRLLLRSVPVSSKRIVFDLLRLPVPQGWQGSALLRNHRLLILDKNETCVVGKCRVRLDEELGLTIASPKEEADA